MARNTFKIVGKLQLGKETEKFKPYKVSKSAKGWLGHRLVFGIKNITGFHNVELFEGYMEDGSSLIYCIKKKENYSDETEKLQIEWKLRNNPDVIEQVADYNKLTIKMDDEQVTKYIAGYDFLQHIYSILQDDRYKDELFIVTGDVEYQKYEGKIYRKLHPRHIELAPKDTQEVSLLNLELYYTQDAVDTEMFDINKKYLVNTYVAQYNSQTKEDDYFSEPVVIDVSKAQTEKQEKGFNIIKNRFIVDEDKVFKLGVKAVLINGKEKKQITMEDLTEEERDLIDCGLATLEEIAAEYGNTINGDSISEIKVVGFGYGYNKGSQETEISPEKLLGIMEGEEEEFTDILFGEEEEELPFM